MSRKEQTVTIRGNDGRHDGVIHEHPAYGIARVSRPQGGHRTMFGSDLNHNSVVRIEISEASEDVHLGTSWISEGKSILEFEMTEAQWAAFVASTGMSPVPVTLRKRSQGKPEMVPDIVRQSSRQDKARREFNSELARGVQGSQELIEDIMHLVSKGKAGKGELNEILGKARKAYTGWDHYGKFASECFEEEMEKIVAGAKVEVEATVQSLVVQTGIRALELNGVDFSKIQRLENKND